MTRSFRIQTKKKKHKHKESKIIREKMSGSNEDEKDVNYLSQREQELGGWAIGTEVTAGAPRDQEILTRKANAIGGREGENRKRNTY